MRMGNVDKAERLRALQELKAESKIKYVIDNKGALFYELEVEEQSPEDLVLEVIKESGRNGIWVRDIRFKSKLPQVAVNKALKSLENRKVIRSVKSISNRKLYVLFELEPDESITGGACYDAGSIKEDVVKNLKSTCFQYLYDRYEESYKKMIANIHSIDSDLSTVDIFVSAKDIEADFQKRNIFQDIKLADIEQILNILLYECKLNKKVVGSIRYFRFNPLNKDKTDLFYTPCMVCHLYKDCKPGSFNIGPENCQYLNLEKFCAIPVKVE